MSTADCHQTVNSDTSGGQDEFILTPYSFTNWINHPNQWSQTDFILQTKQYLTNKNGGIDSADEHLLCMLATQIDVYVKSIIAIQKEGMIASFNGGVTLGPNPHLAIADRALYRSLQVMKELELSPKSRDGYRPASRMSAEIKLFLDGPKKRSVSI